MSHGISVVFRAIPVVMAAVCVSLGSVIATSGHAAGTFVAGRVVAFLGAICLCLFATAATIIRQLISRYAALDKVLYPVLGYGLAAGTAAYGAWLFQGRSTPDELVAGHVVLGLGLISGCVATVAAASREFSRIPENSSSPVGTRARSKLPFSAPAAVILTAIPVALAGAGWALAVELLVARSTPSRFAAGHVLVGLAAVCTSLIALVVSILRQVQDTYTERDRALWPSLVLLMALLNLVWGVVLVTVENHSYYLTPGLVLIGLGLVCLSIYSKVALLAWVWRRTFALANRVPMIPVATALTCLFMAAFVFQYSATNSALFIAARVVVGLGAICFSLFSIVSILESGTSADSGRTVDDLTS
jgi:hypothetical protein